MQTQNDVAGARGDYSEIVSGSLAYKPVFAGRLRILGNFSNVATPQNILKSKMHVNAVLQFHIANTRQEMKN